MNGLTKEQLELISKTVMKEHSKASQRSKKEKRDWRLRNTRLLLNNYRKLKVHCDGIVSDLIEYQEMVFDPNGLQLGTLMQYKAKTAKILNYFDVIFKVYGELSKRDGYAAERRYKIVRRLYMDEHVSTAVELADFYNIDRSTVFRDVTKCIEELSIMLFGIDSFEDLK